MRFSALVLTQDEERHVADCLRSLAPAERIVVIDSGSTDRTREIAAAVTRVEVAQRAFVSFADQRNAGLRMFAPGTWVLHLDADERLTPELAEELAALDPAAEVPAYNVPSRVSFMGRYLLRSAGYPVYQTRLTRAGLFEFEEVGHGQKAPPRYGPLPCLRHPYDHLPFEKGLEEWRRRHERYAEKEAQSLVGGRSHLPWSAWRDPIQRRRWLRQRTAFLPGRPWIVWLYLFVGRRGWLDGPPGWEYCRRRRAFETMVDRHLRLLRQADYR
jgi:glycosyltransferase involved in cell wall biosynthesis